MDARKKPFGKFTLDAQGRLFESIPYRCCPIWIIPRHDGDNAVATNVVGTIEVNSINLLGDAETREIAKMTWSAEHFRRELNYTLRAHEVEDQQDPIVKRFRFGFNECSTKAINELMAVLSVPILE